MEPPTVREVCQRLEQEGWRLANIRGDHRKYARDGIHVVVAGKKSEHLKRGTYTAISKVVGWK